MDPGAWNWVSDAWRGSPAAWNEDLLQVNDVTPRTPDPEERKRLHRLGDGFSIATLAIAEGGTLEVAARPEEREALPGPFLTVTRLV